VRTGAFWNKAGRRQAGFLSPYVDESYGTIKVTYTAGYAPEDIPGELLMAAVQVTARIRFMMPLGLPLGSDSFGGRSISIGTNERNWILGQSKTLLFRYKNRRF
jgi:hypothetical protein